MQIVPAFLFVIAFFTCSPLLHAQLHDVETPADKLRNLLHSLNVEQDSSARNLFVQQYISRLNVIQSLPIEDSTIHLLYYGKAERVSIAGDINRWNPAADTLQRVTGTDLFHLSVSIHPAARFEYKLVVDSIWMLDPLNRQQVMGGFGPNSEITMPLYRPPVEIEYRPEIQHGRLDTIRIHSNILQQTYTTFVYLPWDYSTSGHKRYPSMYVTDGGEYLSLARMNNVLDNMIADKRIRPVVAVFIDARTDIHKPETSTRMQDYAMRDSFVTFLANELRPSILKKYRLDKRPGQTAIMGASLGGLIATYASYKRPDVFGLCAAQSPSFWWMNDSMITLMQQSPKKKIRFYISTGTIHDAQAKASKMRDVMLEKGYSVQYEEHPEGHNWTNWRTRIRNILSYFWKTQ